MKEMPGLGNDFFTRHSKRPKSEEDESREYPGISEEGVEMAKERAKDILELLKKAEPGAVMLIGGVSDQIRTTSTALVYGHEIKDLLALENNSEIEVILPEELKRVEGYFALLNKLILNKDKKFAVVFPLNIPELSYDGDFMEKGKWNAYSWALMKRNNRDSEAILRDWLDNQGEIADLSGPKPKEVAEKQLLVLEKLRRLGKKYLPGRDLLIGAVGHSWALDALAVYLANDGEVTLENFDKMKAKMIVETGMIAIKENEQGDFLQYGDLEIPLEDKKSE